MPKVLSYTLPMHVLPDADGFKFIGITRNDKYVRCEVENKKGVVRIKGAQKSVLVGWQYTNAGRLTPTEEQKAA